MKLTLVGLGLALVGAVAGVTAFALHAQPQSRVDFEKPSNAPVPTARGSAFVSGASLMLQAQDAPDEALIALAQARADLLQRLSREDLRACATQYYGDFPIAEHGASSPQAATLADAQWVALGAAASAAKATPARRPAFKESLNTRLAALIEAKGATSRQQRLAAGDDPASPQEACDAGVLVYRGVTALAREDAAAWMARALQVAGARRQEVELRIPQGPDAALVSEAKRSGPEVYERLIDGYVMLLNGAPEAGRETLARVAKDLGRPPPASAGKA